MSLSLAAFTMHVDPYFTKYIRIVVNYSMSKSLNFSQYHKEASCVNFSRVQNACVSQNKMYKKIHFPTLGDFLHASRINSHNGFPWCHIVQCKAIKQMINDATALLCFIDHLPFSFLLAAFQLYIYNSIIHVRKINHIQIFKHATFCLVSN